MFYNWTRGEKEERGGRRGGERKKDVEGEGKKKKEVEGDERTREKWRERRGKEEKCGRREMWM